jgi:hypothetical protein
MKICLFIKSSTKFIYLLIKLFMKNRKENGLSIFNFRRGMKAGAWNESKNHGTKLTETVQLSANNSVEINYTASDPKIFNCAEIRTKNSVSSKWDPLFINTQEKQNINNKRHHVQCSCYPSLIRLSSLFHG